jgi:glycosidase
VLQDFSFEVVAAMHNRYQPEPYVRLIHPEWTRSAAIYQINTRQFTEAGTFQAAERHLPRLESLGVDILWLMPIHPIGVASRKGSLGSPYAVRDHFAVNPKFGDLQDLRHFVAEAHDLNLRVILDWVANHTACDHALRTEHPEWYARDYKGDFLPTPWCDWDDVIDLDYSQPELRRYMTEAMKYWVRAADIDGYRCDVAGFVPVDFWGDVRKELDAIKPVFMLAEWESRDLHAEAFDMTYAWSWWDAVQNLVQGSRSMDDLFLYYSWNEKAYPHEALRMTFVSNHDKNAWEGTQFESFGDGLEAAIVLSVVGEGFPMIYNGQEAGNPRRLPFFEKKPIDWREHPIGELYRRLLSLKKSNSALWNGQWGARMIPVPNTSPGQVFSFVRADRSHKVFCIINFSADDTVVTFEESLFHGHYVDYLSGESAECDSSHEELLKSWDYRIFVG